VGYKFTLVLSREITDEESAILQEAGCAGAIFGPDSLPTNADVPVTKMDFDDTSSPSLAEAIQSALDAVKKVPELSVPGLTVPAQPAGPLAEAGPQAEAGQPAEVLEGVVVEEPPATRKSRARKPAAKKPAAKKASPAPAGNGTAPADDAMEPVEATAGSA
jgi:hypothetical protein